MRFLKVIGLSLLLFIVVMPKAQAECESNSGSYALFCQNLVNGNCQSYTQEPYLCYWNGSSQTGANSAHCDSRNATDYVLFCQNLINGNCQSYSSAPYNCFWSSH